jgi:hypothetical protein
MARPEDLLIKSALQQQPTGPFVEVPGFGQVPAEVGVFLAVNNLAQVVQQLIMHIDAVHHHLAAKEHPKSASRRFCGLCQAQSEMAAKIKEIQEHRADEPHGPDFPPHTHNAEGDAVFEDNEGETASDSGAEVPATGGDEGAA